MFTYGKYIVSAVVLTLYYNISALSPGALLLKRCCYMKCLHEVTVCDIVSAQWEMGCARDEERLSDLVAVMANIDISEE